ncbi:ribosomal protein S18-alanine N-acetyltransferase [Pseudidiomarina aestuarii]|uniref:ribosomal protein S18-alanine N-acetyltransferase n=1 Tax=Pseudidiomarina aestuarii TaxID=624146 RepID=UPI001474FC6F|nr:ribosomal protein S18-alanine N-acetyltransferase [Pseudidiomarina aestuarii]
MEASVPAALIKPLEWQQAIVEIEQQGQDYPWTEAVLRSCFDDAHYESWGIYVPQLCGFVITHSILDERTIMNIVVHPNERGKGYGRELVSVVKAIAQEQQQSLWLEVRSSNTVAQSLYQAMGFSVVGQRPNYYQTADGSETAIIMQWMAGH